MASLRSKLRSPFHYLDYRDLDTGKWRRKSLKLRRDNPAESRRAQKIAEEHSRKEAQVGNMASGNFAAWVPTFLQDNYLNLRSLARYTNAWTKVWAFLKDKGIHHPRQFRWEHVNEYIRERKKQGVQRNTAVLEIKAFGTIMREAVRRDYCERNTVADGRIPKDPAKKKPLLTVKQHDLIRKHLETRLKWMLTVFEIQSHLGCRFNECAFNKANVDFRRKLISITDSKRKPEDPKRNYTVPLPTALGEYLRKVFKTQAFTVKPLSGDDNTRFNKELNSVCEGASSHSLRISFVTRCHEEGLPMQMAMSLVNHSSEIIHRVYTRVPIAELVKWAKKVPPPTCKRRDTPKSTER